MAGLVVLGAVLLHPAEARAPLSVRIGAVFGSDETELGEDFVGAVKHLNSRQDVLNGTRLDSYQRYTESFTPLSAHMVTCSELALSVLAIFSSSSTLNPFISSIASQFNVPHFSSLPLPASSQDPFTVYLAPSRDDITDAVLSAILGLKLRRVGLVFHSVTGVLHTMRLLEMLQSSGLEVEVVDLAGADIRPDLAKLRRRGVYSCIVDIGPDLVNPFLQQAMQAGLVNAETTFLFTTLDFEYLDFGLAEHSGSTILGLSLNQPLIEGVASVSGHQAALLHDSVELFARALQHLSLTTDPEVPDVSCTNMTGKFAGGQPFMDAVRAQAFTGLTGPIKLQDQGREELSLRVLALAQQSTPQEVGRWLRTRDLTAFTPDLLTNVEELRRAGRESVVLVWEEKKEEEAVVQEILQHLASLHAAAVYRTVNNSALVKQDEVAVYWDAYPTQVGDLDETQEPGQLHQQLEPTDPVLMETIYIITRAGAGGGGGGDVFLVLLLGLLALFVCSISLSLTSKISPYQRRAATYSLQDSLWVTSSGLFLRSWDLNLQGVSSRVVSLLWWMFSSVCFLLLLLSSSPSTRPPPSTFYTVQDNPLHLSQVSGGEVWGVPSQSIKGELSSVVEGLQLLHDQPGAAIVLSAKAASEVDCEYRRERVGLRPISFWLRKNSVWRRRLNSAIHRLRRAGLEPRDTVLPHCTDSINTNTVFYYLVGGTLGGAVLSLLLAALELIIYSVNSARRRRSNSRKADSWWKHLTKEVKLALRGEEKRTAEEVVEDEQQETAYSLPNSPDKGSLHPDQSTLTHKLLSQKHCQDNYENSRL